jgi:hypothetical protein
MTTITLPEYPNSRFSASIDNKTYTITIRTFGDMTMFSIADENGAIYNGCRAITGQWLIPYKYLSQNGNFRFESEHSEEYPYYTGFNTDFKLVYYTADEVEEIGW